MNNGNLWLVAEGERGWEVIKVRALRPLGMAGGFTTKRLRKLLNNPNVLVKTPAKMTDVHGKSMWVRSQFLFVTKEAAEYAAVMFAIGVRDT